MRLDVWHLYKFVVTVLLNSLLLGACPRISILFKIEVFQKNKHSHIRDIASIIFLKTTKSLGEMHSRTSS